MIVEFNKRMAEERKAYKDIEAQILGKKEKGLDYLLEYTYNIVNGFLNISQLPPLNTYPEKESLRDKLEVTSEAWAFLSSFFLNFSYEEEGTIGAFKRGSKVLKYLGDEKFSRWGIEILEENGLEFVDLTAEGVLVREKYIRN
jgi:hypothetical protein